MRKMMMNMVYKLSNFHRREEGQSLVEYGLIIALIAIVVAAVLLTLGPKIAELFGQVQNTL